LSLVDALKDRPKRAKIRRIDEILASVSGPEQQALTEALSDMASWPSDALARTLTEQGYPIGEASVRRYRRDILGGVVN